MKFFGLIAALTVSGFSSLGFGAIDADALISCRLDNGKKYEISRTPDGQYHLYIGGLRPEESTSENSFLVGLGVPAASIPHGSVYADVTFPSNTCLFPENALTPKFTCEWDGKGASVALTFRDIFDKEIASVPVGYILVEQHTSVVNALRRINGITKNVTWNHNPVLFYIRPAGQEGGPSLGSTYRNEGFTSDDAGHGGCKANLR